MGCAQSDTQSQTNEIESYDPEIQGVSFNLHVDKPDNPPGRRLSRKSTKRRRKSRKQKYDPDRLTPSKLDHDCASITSAISQIDLQALMESNQWRFPKWGAYKKCTIIAKDFEHQHGSLMQPNNKPLKKQNNQRMPVKATNSHRIHMDLTNLLAMVRNCCYCTCYVSRDHLYVCINGIVFIL